MQNAERGMMNGQPRGRDARKRKPALRTRHRFFLNPYSDVAFTKCPKCEAKTKQRKVPLVIHIEPKQIFVLNKTCRYCERCDLLIGRQADIEAMMAAIFEARCPEIVGNEYLVVGTLDRSDWRARAAAETRASDLVNRVYVFEDVWRFDVDRGGPGQPARPIPPGSVEGGPPAGRAGGSRCAGRRPTHARFTPAAPETAAPRPSDRRAGRSICGYGFCRTLMVCGGTCRRDGARSTGSRGCCLAGRQAREQQPPRSVRLSRSRAAGAGSWHCRRHRIIRERFAQ
jgi:hypothetical protein